MLTKHLTDRDAGAAIDALLRAGAITPVEADALRGGGAMLLAIGGGEAAGAALDAGRRAARKRGRPPAADNDAIRRAEEMVATGSMTLRAAAVETGVPRSTLSDRLGLGGRPGRPASLGAEGVAEARRRLAVPGAKVAEVAASLGVSPPTLRRALNRPDTATA